MRQVQRNRKKQVSETKTEEELDIDLIEVSDSGFSVEVTKKEFTAQAVEDGGERILDFQEETETEEFSVAFVEQNYLDMIPSAWEVLEGMLQSKPVNVPVSPSLSIPVIEEEPVSSPENLVVQPETGPESKPEKMPGKVLSQPYEDFVRGVETVEYRPGMDEDGERSGSGYIPVEEIPLEQEEEMDMHLKQYQSQGRSRTENERNAVEVVQEMFEETELEGEVEQLESYGLTDDFEGEAPEAYWVDIEGMDMERTEYFINGELAEDSIDAYSLGPEDTITFVESELFYTDGSEGASCSGELRLDEAIPEAESIESYDTGEVFNGLEPVIETGYTPSAA
ncbi:MAG: hypothetical protein MUP63_02510 [Candidatus Nanohaloarchaeota archaeon QJJ-7]|nr:hypothetical protein [Candidatus Nanohaloarchaeota archaeon QJJ-7]